MLGFGESNDGVIFAGDGQYQKTYRSKTTARTGNFLPTFVPLYLQLILNNIVYAGARDGLFATTDNGISWAQNNFLANVPVPQF